jgi:spore coat polysaccharide biosynthesis protein SpsF (cytidylyltransferase family)
MAIITVKLNKEIDYSNVIVANKLDANPQLVEIGKQLFLSASKALETNKENGNRIITDMFSRWQFTIFQNTVVAHVTRYLESCFDAQYDESEIEKIAEDIVAKNPKAKKEDVITFVKRTEFQKAILDFLAEE